MNGLLGLAALVAVGVGLLSAAGSGAGGSAQVEVVGTLPSPVASLAQGSEGQPRSLHALTATGELWRLDARPRRLAVGLSPEAPLRNCGGRQLAVTRGGGLWWDGPKPLSGLSLQAAPACAPDGAALMVSGSGELWRISPDGTLLARAATKALPDARLTLADLRGDGHPLLAVLAGPDAARYVHGVLGDGLEASRLTVLDGLTLLEVARLTLPAPFVFEDLEARPVRIGGRWTLAVVRSGPQGGGALALVGMDGGELKLLAVGPDFAQPGRWLAPLTDGGELYAVHTPHIGGVLHRYALTRAGQTGTGLGQERLSPTRLAGDLSTHRIGDRRITGGVWRGTVWAASQDGAATVGWPTGLRLSAAPSSPLLNTGQAAYLGLQDGRVVRLPDRP